MQVQSRCRLTKITFDTNKFIMSSYKNLYILFFVLFLSLSSKSQQTAIFTSDSQNFNRAVSLYQSKQYRSANILFQKVKSDTKSLEIKSDSDFYIAKTSVYQDKVLAINQYESFIKNYPTSLNRNQATADLGFLYFEDGQYEKALEWFEKVDETAAVEDADKLNFQRGFSLYKANNKKEATKNFNKVLNSTEYAAQAKYYLGFMAYENDNYKEANFQFSQIQNDDKLKEKLSYYQTDMNFKQGKFQDAIESGTLAMQNSNESEKSELNKIIGESYFNLNQFEKSIPFLERYKGKNGKWSNTDYYLLGYAYYKKNDYEKAIFHFNKIIGGNDFVAQNAYYHLGESYLKSSKKQQALNAFKSASEMSFDLKLQEDAAFNYAKLSYEIGNSYSSIPVILSDFIVKYPSNPNNSELKSLLIDSYISSKDYKNALELIDKNKSNGNRIALQKVTFYLGLENFSDGKYTEALALFKRSIAISENPKFVARATFWEGETAFTQNNYNDAIISFKQFIDFKEAAETPEFQNIYYNLGHSYFKIKEYATALDYFQKYILTANIDNARLADANVRIADCHFITAKYWAAIESYRKAVSLKSADSDYATFQVAICYGFLNRNDKKVTELMALLKSYPKSQYADDAMYELGNTYATLDKNEEAISSYDTLLSSFPNGNFAAKAMLKQGLIFFNSDKNDLAMTKLKQVTTDFPNTSEAFEAVSTIKLIYIENGKVADYVSWIKTVKYFQVDDLELDNDTFAAAEKFYLQNDNKKAIDGFTTYLSSFPNGVHALKVNFFLGQLFVADSLENNAISHYEYVIAKPNSNFSEPSLARLAQIYLNQKVTDKALAILIRLEKEGSSPAHIGFAQANLMKIYFEKADFVNAVVFAEKVINNPKSDEKVKNDAQIIVARSAFKTNDLARAKSAYSKLLLTATGALAAEALYYDAYFKNQEKKFEISNASIQKLTKNYPSQQYFGAKGLIIMAKNFYGLKDAFQANFILESVIKNFGNFADVIEEAKIEQEIIQKEEAKTNSSLQKL